MKYTSVICLVTVCAVLILDHCEGKSYYDACVQHRDCVRYQYCSGNEYSCCSPAYDDPTDSMYCWCCSQDCSYVDGNYCWNASFYYGSRNRDHVRMNQTTASGSANNNRRRKITIQSHDSQPTSNNSNDDKISNLKETKTSDTAQTNH